MSSKQRKTRATTLAKKLNQAFPGLDAVTLDNFYGHDKVDQDGLWLKGSEDGVARMAIPSLTTGKSSVRCTTGRLRTLSRNTAFSWSHMTQEHSWPIGANHALLGVDLVLSTLREYHLKY